MSRVYEATYKRFQGKGPKMYTGRATAGTRNAAEHYIRVGARHDGVDIENYTLVSGPRFVPMGER